MNASRRKQIEKISAMLEDLQSQIECICDEEQESYDNLPESLQCSERGDKMENAIDNLNSAAESVRECLEYLEEAVQ